MKINYTFSELQYLELDECRKKAAEIALTIERLGWLFDIGSKEEAEFIKYSHLAEKIECFCEEQLPF